MPASLSKILQLECDQDEDELMLLSLMSLQQQKNKKPRKHRWWVNKLIQERNSFGTFYHLVKQLDSDEESFKAYFRLTREQFTQVLHFDGPHLSKKHITREPICPRQQLAICIRFLATGETFKSLAYSCPVGASTVGKTVPRVCHVIWDTMVEQYMRMPQSHDDWRLIAEQFNDNWTFPNCIGAIGGQHVVIQAPHNSGSMYFNYKKTFSIVLLPLVDANLKFICIDVGSYGRNSDSGIFSRSNLGRYLYNNLLNIPPDHSLPGGHDYGVMPYVIIGDEAFLLHKHLMRPYPGKAASREKQFFNYRLSRARRIVENAFGVLSVRWGVFYTRMAIQPDTVMKIVKAACLLHNMIQTQTTSAATTQLLHDYDQDNCDGIQNLTGFGTRGTIEAIDVRERFKQYFINVNPLSWQTALVTRGEFTE